MIEQKFQKQVLEQLAQQGAKLDSIETRLGSVKSAQNRQLELNQVVIGELEKLGKMRTDLTIMAESGLMQQAELIREQNRMYVETQRAEHEADFH